MKLKEFFTQKKILSVIFYFFLTITLLFLIWFGITIFKMDVLIEDIELKTLDLRFQLPFQRLQHDENIVVLAIDNTSLEILGDELGRWPWSRDIHAKVAEALVKSGAESVVFDLMFLGKAKGFEKQDKMLADTIAKYKNIYIAMNFDNMEDFNTPEILNLISRLSIKLNNESLIDFSDSTFTNCRTLLPEYLKATTKIGIINHSKDDDGLSRRNSLLFQYHEKFYPYLAVKVAIDRIAKKLGKEINELTLTKDNHLLIGDTSIPLQNDGKMLLNWYGACQTFTYIPIWKVIKTINGKEPLLDMEETFKGKTVFIGATADSLYDIKITPFSKVHPGVELQATVLNNILQQDFLVRVPGYINFIICLALILLTGTIVYKIRSGFLTFCLTTIIIFTYLIGASLLFLYSYIWIDIIYPMIAIAMTFTTMYVIKYVMKSRDFEYTYQLATTDGLTGLHNHRYFQERMVVNLERCRRYGTPFSLLLIDIDFFKKFNDNYGHQAGDCVLKQVAETLKKSVRASDLVARYGGEEMAIVLDNANIDEAVLIANKVCKTIANRTFRLSESVEKNVTISVGVATFPEHGDTVTSLIEFADKCLYRAKESGRNRVGDLYDNQKLNIEDYEKRANIKDI